MMNNKDGGPAYPIQFKDDAGIDLVHAGMSLRDYFAGQALNGMLSHATRYRPVENDPRHWHEVISQESYMIADAMIKERDK